MLASDGHRGDSAAGRPPHSDQRQFTVVRRGLDEAEVRKALRDLGDRLAEEQRKRAELEAKVSSAAGLTLDETTLMSKLGEETARVLTVAHEAAADLRTKAEARAEELRTEAAEAASATREAADTYAATLRQTVDEEAAEHRAAVETELGARREEVEAELDALAAEATRRRDEIAEERRRASGALEDELAHRRDEHASELGVLREHAEREATHAVEEAKEQGRSMVAEARAVRERILLDLDRRRRTLNDQIGELERSRDRLVRSVDAVRLQASEAMSALERAGAPQHQRSVTGYEPEDFAPAVEVETDGEVSSVMMGELGTVDFSAFDIDLSVEEAVSEAEPTEVAEVAEVSEAAEATEDADATESDESVPAAETTDTVGALFARLKAGDADDAVRPGDASTEDIESSEDASEQPTISAPEIAEVEDSQDAPLAPEVNALVTRDHALEPLQTAAARRLKRLLQDNQNELLDSLRSVKPKSKKVAVEPDRSTEWWAAFEDSVERAARAGALAAGGDESFGITAAATLARPVVGSEAQTWTERISAALNGEAADAHNVVTALFREYRREDLEAFVDHVLVGAYNSGVVAASPEGAVLAWVCEVGVLCPEADDNALEPTRCGDAFPTGQAFPPAHPGCRCLVLDSALLGVASGSAAK